MFNLLSIIALLGYSHIGNNAIQHLYNVTHRERLLDDLEIVTSRGLDLEYPNRFAPDVLLAHQNIDYWKNILPFPEDKDAQRYLVAPIQGAIVPITTLSHNDYETVFNGGKIDTMPYLENGALHHPGTLGPWDGSGGNYVLAGHTSYYSYRSGRYKTTMQFLALMQPGDILWLFNQKDNGVREKYNFVVSKSFETESTNTTLLEQPLSGNQITVYGCYPFGTLAKRWVVQGSLR